jgi:FGGY-family pentulose kinase
MKEQDYLLGIDFGTGGVRAALFDIRGKQKAFDAQPISLSIPKTGYAEQDMDEWWAALQKAVRGCLIKADVKPSQVAAIGADGTSCTPVFLDKELKPLRPAIMWMDARAAGQAKRIAACGDSALKYNGYGNVPYEWMPCKALWVKENEPEVYKKAEHVMECIDWLMVSLTGNLTASLNNVSARWYYDNDNGGFPVSFYEKIGLRDVLDKFPKTVLPMGALQGKLTERAAKELGLLPGIPVAQGGADAYVGMIGLNVVAPGRMALVTGSSHLHLGLADVEIHKKGILGGYPDAIVPGLYMVEGGQISTGSIVNWFKENLAGYAAAKAERSGRKTYDVLNEEAALIAPGSDGIVMLDYFQGNRTPYTDGEVRGLFYGFTIKHTEAHIYRAILEGIAYGTEHILQTFAAGGYRVDALYACGGATKSPLWMKIHSDVSNVPIYIPEEAEAPSLGSAILGSVAAGMYPDIPEASKAMVTFVDKVEPDPEAHAAYGAYTEKYMEAYPLMNEWMRGVTSLSK